MWRRIAGAVAVALLGALTGAPGATADFQYVAGQQDRLGPQDGVCPGFGVFADAGYHRNATGVDPRAGEPFYLEVRLTYLESFDCAAAFTGIQMTLPAGLTPVGSPARVACQRFRLGTGAVDPRTAANCPLAPVALGGGTYALDPVVTNFPERAAFGRRFWFQGYDGAQTYRDLRLLVPVSAAGALSAAPVTFTMKRFDAVATWTASVGVTTTGGAPPSGGSFVKPDLNVQNGPGDVQVSPIGYQVPFAVRKGSTAYGVSEFVQEGTGPLGTTPYKPCTEGATSTSAFTADEAFVHFYGDFGDAFGVSPPCDLDPGVTYTSELCAAAEDAAPAKVDCETTVFTTPPVDLSGEVTHDPADARRATFRPVLRGAWPQGSHRLLLRRPGGSFLTVSSLGTLRGTGEITDFQANTVTDLVPWRDHDLRACFMPSGRAEACAADTTFVAGRVAAGTPQAGTDRATVPGLRLSAPHPAVTVQLRARPAAEATGQGETALPVVAAMSLAAAAAAGDREVPALEATGLQPATRYAWTVCVEADADPAPERCTPGAAFTTAALPPPPGGGGGTQPPPADDGGTPPPPPSSPGPTSGGGSGPAITDRQGPAVSLAVRGALRRGRRVRLVVTAKDPAGVAGVTIAVGRRKPVRGRTATVRLGRLPVRVVVTATDRLGNRTVLRRSVVARRGR